MSAWKWISKKRMSIPKSDFPNFILFSALDDYKKFDSHLRSDIEKGFEPVDDASSYFVLHFRLPSRTLIAMEDQTNFRCTLKRRLVQGHLQGICLTAFRTRFHFALLIIGAQSEAKAEVAVLGS